MSADLRLVGIEELSASALRTRLLGRGADFWAGSPLDEAAVHALHDPLFFHQLGGFGAVAMTPANEDVGYLLGLVSADRLALVHAVAVDVGWRRRGVATRLLERFASLATAVGARVVQAVVPVGDPALTALADRWAAQPTLSLGHAGPGDDRLVLTRPLTGG